MVNQLARYAKTIGFVIDLVTMVAGYYLAYTISSALVGNPIFSYLQTSFFETQVLCYVSWTLALALCVDYPSRRKTGVMRDFTLVITTNLAALLIFSVTTFILKEVFISRFFIVTFVATQVLLMFLNRYLVRLVLYILRHSGWDSRTRIIVGTGLNATHYLEEVATNRRFGLRILGYVADVHAGLDVPYLGRVHDIESILTTYAPDGVVVALNITDPNIEQVIRACDEQGTSIELLLDGLSSQIASSTVHHGTKVSSLALSAIPHTPTSLFIKRVTDVAVSLLAIILLSPLFLCVAIAIKVEDGGPVLFVQNRVGLRNRTFSMYKFRSMRVDAETLKASLLHLNEMSGPVFKLTNDPRVTRIGAFIRRTSLDELPQLFNVLIGNMSVVGPRPPLPSEVALYDHVHRRRLSVKPGLTCLWQIAGRNDIDFDRWMELDLAYIDNWSYLNDLKIMVQTIPAVLRRHGAR